MHRSASSAQPSLNDAKAKSRYPWGAAVLFFAVVLGGTALDLWSKSWIFAELGMPGEKPPIWLWQDVFCLKTSLNEGALFGLGQGHGMLFVALSGVALVGILVWVFALGAIRDLRLVVALGCVAAGTIGNLYDRLGLPGLLWKFPTHIHTQGEPVFAVRDWLYFSLIDWPIFNIADSLLVCGAALLLWHAYFHVEPVSAAEAEPKATPARTN